MSDDHEHDLKKIAEVHLSPSLMFEMSACLYNKDSFVDGKMCAAVAFAPILPDKDAENRVGESMGKMAAGAIRSMMIMEMVSIMGSENLSGIFQILGHGMKQVVEHPEMLLTMGEKIAEVELGLNKEQVDLLRKSAGDAPETEIVQNLMDLSEQMTEQLSSEEQSKKKEEVNNLDKLWDTAPEDGDGKTTTT